MLICTCFVGLISFSTNLFSKTSSVLIVYLWNFFMWKAEFSIRRDLNLKPPHPFKKKMLKKNCKWNKFTRLAIIYKSSVFFLCFLTRKFSICWRQWHFGSCFTCEQFYVFRFFFVYIYNVYRYNTYTRFTPI